MWNKHEEPAVRPTAGASPLSSLPAPEATLAGGAAIGPSITIVGELKGDEDVTVLGSIEGTIDLPKNSVTIGRSARVSADIRAKIVSVEGEVRGNLQAGEQILIRKTATMLGNLSAPRVGLEDGCRFKGNVDMESANAARPLAAPQVPKPEAARGAAAAASVGPPRPDALPSRG